MQRRHVLGTGLAAVTVSFLPSVTARSKTLDTVLERLRLMRAKKGLQDVVAHPALTAMARSQTLHMRRVGNVTHMGPDGSDPPTRGRQAGYSGQILGEAIADSQEAADDTVKHWLVHDATRAVLLDPMAQHVGLASFKDAKGRTFWDLILGA